MFVGFLDQRLLTAKAYGAIVLFRDTTTGLRGRAPSKPANDTGLIMFRKTGRGHKSGMQIEPHAVEPFSAYSFGLAKEYGVWRDATRRI